ncbi:MAG: quinolinate synthase NadA [Candidatus Krumholzibacteria bacterium]|jgi:quinolinate synthase|nr:quinolinate synthase NadA [Candidatus Krumholzibacteria bacterium]MDP6669827.1 quinolinate synthase NadA [Candidatus Krumholzibacteria bacterium]MDP6796915.1 quinolinate synthase NadA [Candidatus Krumholzibacteria bacterium]MDP7021438.1 quinolinate synthase NadA [Candidatus Krumholzibacteria bacterium]
MNPETLIDPTLHLEEEIQRLKRERNAVLLAHYYQESEIQDLADELGDSLALAQAAKKAKAEVIVFAGVHFMAETAKILNPESTVLVPDMEAGCSLADSCPAEDLAAWKAEHPDHAVIAYINCTAETKAQADLICTSSNAEKVVRSIPEDQPILFVPDKNLGAWLIKQTGRDMELWPGTCIVHETFSERKILEEKARRPGALFIAHPECEEAVLRHADFVGSTKKLLDIVQSNEAEEFIVGTETGILHQMQKLAPGKTLVPAPYEEGGCACNECPYMKLNTMEKLYRCLRDMEPRIEMKESLREKALLPLERMLAL